MVSQNTMEFESSVIWQRIKDDLPGSEVKGKPMSYDTEDFGTLSQKKVIGILKDVFGAEPPRHTGTTKKLIFNKNKFDRLDSVYNLELEIKVGRGTGKNNDIGLDKHIPTLCYYRSRAQQHYHSDADEIAVTVQRYYHYY